MLDFCTITTPITVISGTRYQDDATKFRAALRTQTLQMKGRGVDYNVLTGAVGCVKRVLHGASYFNYRLPDTGETAPLVTLPPAPLPAPPLARAGSASSLTAGGRMTLGRV